MKAVAVLCLIVAACAPARLERLPESIQVPVAASSDLTRALNGATDPAACRSLGKWIEETHRDGHAHSLPGFKIRYAMSANTGDFAPGYFDRLETASEFRIRGLKHQRVEGIGVPTAGFRENKGREPVERWYPPEGITRPVTAVAIPGKRIGGIRQVEIRLVDRMRVESVRLGGKNRTLAADFTVPFASLLERTGPLHGYGFTSLLRRRSDREAGFALMEPYDPQRTPLILIHGLLSTPLAWADLTNELWAAPSVRQRYQIWHYLYPTNPPALYSARVMRGQLDELRAFLDPKGGDPAMRRTVVVGHSMGGLLTKTLVVEPRDAFWNAAFTRPLSSLDVTPAERKTLEEAFFWKPRRHVDRVIFCSVPFQGSRLASSWIGRTGAAIVAPSPAFQDFYREVERKNPGMLQPDYSSLTQGKISSVSALAPRQRSMEILDQLPVIRGTAVHLITGSMDTIVHRSSATVRDAESSIEVAAGHGSFHHPDAVAEIIRILNLPPAR